MDASLKQYHRLSDRDLTSQMTQYIESLEDTCTSSCEFDYMNLILTFFQSHHKIVLAMYRILTRMLRQNLKMDVMGLVVKSDVPVLLVHWGLVVVQVLMEVKVHKVFVVCLVFKVNPEIQQLLINQLETRVPQVAQVLLGLQVNQDKLDGQDQLANLAKGESLV